LADDKKVIEMGLERMVMSRRSTLEMGMWHLRSKFGATRQSEASRENIESMLKFDFEYKVLGKSPATRLNHMSILHSFAEYLKSKRFEDVTKDDVIKYFEMLEGRNVAEISRSVRMTFLKTFYKWLNNGEDYPDCVRWMKPKTIGTRTTVKMILTEDDIGKLISIAKSFRNMAMVAVLYESACRISEFLGMQIKDIEYDDYGVRVKVTGKTGSRYIRLVNSVPHLKEWLKRHPDKSNPEAYIWTKGINIATPMSQIGMNTLLKRLRKETDINKPVNPHSFRKSRLTHIATRLTGTVLNKFAGWTTGSNQQKNYVFHDEDEVDRTILSQVHNMTNLDKAEEVIERLLPQICHNCGEKNMAEVDYCTKCNMSLKIEEFKKRVEQNEWFVNKIVASPEMFQAFIKSEIQKAIEELFKLRAGR